MKIIKTIAVLFSALTGSLVVPVFGQWYFEKTGIFPIGFYLLSAFGGIGYIILMMVWIWNKESINNK